MFVAHISIVSVGSNAEGERLFSRTKDSIGLFKVFMVPVLHAFSGRRSTTSSETLNDMLMVAEHGKKSLPKHVAQSLFIKKNCDTVNCCIPLPA